MLLKTRANCQHLLWMLNILQFQGFFHFSTNFFSTTAFSKIIISFLFLEERHTL